MQAVTSIINVVGTQPIPELDKQYNQWYNEVHIPMALKHPNVLGVTRYQIMTRVGRQRHSPSESNPNYGKYLTIYRYANEESYRTYATSPVRAEIKEDTQRTWTPAQLSVTIRAPYLTRGTWEAPKKTAVGLIRILGLNIDPQTLEGFNDWFGDVFVPATLRAPSVLGLSRHELLSGISGFATVGYLVPPEEGYPRSLVIIYFENATALRSYESIAEVSAVNEELNRLWKPCSVKVLVCIEYQIIKTWTR